MKNKGRLNIQQIVDETVDYYKDKTRSYGVNGDCSYNGMDTHCAVGRCLLTKYKEMGQDLPANESGVECLIEEFVPNTLNPEYNWNGYELDNLIEEKYRGQHISFWRELQSLHDDMGYWMDNPNNRHGYVLSYEGAKKVRKIIKQYS